MYIKKQYFTLAKILLKGRIQFTCVGFFIQYFRQKNQTLYIEFDKHTFTLQTFMPSILVMFYRANIVQICLKDYF